jgi:hypothetical protein
MDLSQLKPLLELGGLGLFAFMVYREQVAMRKALHGLRSDFGAFFVKLMERGGGK